jgi:hypothetical protein
METYYTYLRWCRDYNERNLIDPTSDKMEWHHTLPQCIFGDIRIGLWLTLKQHAIATALQTLAFNRNCLCPWHIQHLPGPLWAATRPFFVKFCKENTSPEQRTQNALKMLERRDPAYLEHNGRNVGVIANTTWRIENPVEYVENRRKGAETQHKQRWICVVTGYVSTPGPLSRYQKARGIDHKDPNNRRRIA